MRFQATEIPGVLVIEPRVFADERGFFMETYHQARFAEAGLMLPFVQSNHSRSCRDTLRGLHFQQHYPQGKLVRAVRGEIFDVAVDLRPSSPTFGRWVGQSLSEENQLELYIPPGLAHGFCVVSDSADVVYQCTEIYHPEDERTILWSDRDLSIAWPISNPLVSQRDRRGSSLAALKLDL